ncbi:hypothetical protein C8F04DRAFT_1387053 [Mycena alexandri]|uniref:Uncharacterized protein n=1 Tax=Mycena alexandri TaxID=1745969 RepID=A0AAD6TPF1_9AGAR|nr:hypothetical protein C8F04DRAFT_1387053 [Mycena alexandri]
MDHPASSSSTERVSPSEDRQTFKPAAQELQAAELVHAVVQPQDLKPRCCVSVVDTLNTVKLMQDLSGILPSLQDVKPPSRSRPQA